MLTEMDGVTGFREAACGFMGGVLVLGGITLFFFSGTFWAVDAAFTAMGVICIADAAFPFGRQPHMAFLTGGCIAGFAAVLASAALGITYLLCTAALAAFLLLLLARKFGGRKKH